MDVMVSVEGQFAGELFGFKGFPDMAPESLHPAKVLDSDLVIPNGHCDGHVLAKMSGRFQVILGLDCIAAIHAGFIEDRLSVEKPVIVDEVNRELFGK